jgi:pimeloyl-ACP methyl ester carboxylesterase
MMSLIKLLIPGLLLLWQFSPKPGSNYMEGNNMEKVISKDGTIISVMSKGEGPPLLFVHGITADHNSWTAIASRFEQHFTVYAMDRRGRGESGDGHDYNLTREAEDIAAVIEHLNEPVNLVGHSYGGLCALEATLLTSKIRRLVLYEPAINIAGSPYPKNAPEQIKERIDGGNLEEAMEYFLREIAKMPENELEMYRKMPLWKARIPLVTTIPREMAAELSYQFEKQKFSNMRVPTMLLLGGESPSFAAEAAKTVNSALPISEIVILPGEQHIAHHTNPELFAKKINDFLQD